MNTLTASDTWKALEQRAADEGQRPMSDFFQEDPQRFATLSLQVGGLFLDYSKNRLTPATLAMLFRLAESARLAERRDQMFAGQPINTTEQRPVLHVALRNQGSEAIPLDGRDIMPAVREMKEKLYRFSAAVRSATWVGYSGKPITDIVNLGIGGSDLGPKMVCRALDRFQHPELNLHFVSNVDGRDILRVLRRLDPETTLFIVSSKTFSTQETLLNARTARAWFRDKAGASAALDRHFVAVTTNAAAAGEFGIPTDNVFGFWDWVGGRYSLWSSIGLPIVLCIGVEGFEALLQGAYDMDCHFCEAPWTRNMPVILALLGIWNANFLGAETQAIVPYDQPLEKLPAFLQQLDMESNGKSIDLDGERVNYTTGPIVWGETGSNGQHAFFQLLHQGTRFVPIDFIASLKAGDAPAEHQYALLTNMVAQANAFMTGNVNQADAAYSVCPGNRPSNVILLDELSPRNLGALIALYEHKVFVQGVIWNLNSFDQWGVQLGKKLATDIASGRNGNDAGFDASTQGLMAKIRGAIQPSAT